MCFVLGPLVALLASLFLRRCMASVLRTCSVPCCIVLPHVNQLVRVCGGEFIEIIIDNAPLQKAMLRFSWNILLLSLVISAIIFFVVDGNLFVNAINDLSKAFWNFSDAEQMQGALRIEVNAHQWAWDARYAGPCVSLWPSSSFLASMTPVAFLSTKST